MDKRMLLLFTAHFKVWIIYNDVVILFEVTLYIYEETVEMLNQALY